MSVILSQETEVENWLDWTLWITPLIPVLEKQRWIYLCEWRPAWATQDVPG